ncbi:MAG: carboxylating nicotinate-nucleotide diphosphorylase [Desulfobacteraceae bacterium]|nr:carboxylating nicotinate-nucleotide diphosphorylase [Desulfobacteraceae bacterium]
MNTTDRLIELALDEDLGSGDLTTDALLGDDDPGRAEIVAKEPLILCGLEVVKRVFARVDSRVACQSDCRDGDPIAHGTTVMRLEGPLKSLLHGERPALNFLQRLSGIATHVRTWVDALGPSRARLVDTRKTTPGWRVLEKYAVRIGGAANHRMGLYDGVLIKDNHIIACGGIGPAVATLRRHISHLVKIEVEVADLAQVEEALTAGADVIMLDNMDLETIRKAVQRIDGRALVEVSGRVRRDTLRPLADTGVDLISAGALTHQARAVDLSMRVYGDR